MRKVRYLRRRLRGKEVKPRLVAVVANEVLGEFHHIDGHPDKAAHLQHTRRG